MNANTLEISSVKRSQLITPHGGKLQTLLVSPERAQELKRKAVKFPSLTLSDRRLCDLELLLVGGFSPLQGFMTRDDYDGVVREMRLADGTLWPIPITLSVDTKFSSKLRLGGRLALRDETGLLLAVLHLEDVWIPDLPREAYEVYGTTSTGHPGVAAVVENGRVYLGGRIEGVQLPKHYDFQHLRQTPSELRERFERGGWSRVVAFQTRNPMHRAHKELTDRAAEAVNGSVLIHPVVGMTKPGDVDHFTRVRCYQRLLRHYSDSRVLVSLLPLAMRMAGPREAVWHAIIRKNYGCSHFIVGRDHAGPGTDAAGKPFYEPYDARDLLLEYESELGVGVIPFEEMVYVPSRDTYDTIDAVKSRKETFASISGTEVRRRLTTGESIPEWFSYPEVVDELRRSYPPRHEQGFTVFFTGLSGSGKSTIAGALLNRLMEETGRPISILDGDVVRTNLSRGLGFSREDRSVNVRRIGYVASEITKHRGIAICAPIAPYESDRRANRELISASGGYVEVFVDAPLAVCEQRDVKGLYAKARAGLLKEFTGIDDPYEPPVDAEVVCRTAEESVEQSVEKIVQALRELGYLRVEAPVAVDERAAA